MKGDDTSGPDTYCQPVLCDENEYVNDSNQCVARSPGTYNGSGDDSRYTSTTCDAIFCSENYRVSDHTCVICDMVPIVKRR